MKKRKELELNGYSIYSPETYKKRFDELNKSSEKYLIYLDETELVVEVPNNNNANSNPNSNGYPDNPNNYVDIFSHWMNLMGDPTLNVWTDLPTSLNINFESVHFPRVK